MKTEERVLCFERSSLNALGDFQGLSLDVEKYFTVAILPANVFIPRSEAELDLRYKQLIPYVMVTSGNTILRYRRGKRGQENRLHGKLSVGIGGHISDEDVTYSGDRYTNGMRRELSEEIGLDTFRDTVVAALNDDSDAVGKVHFGIVHVVTVPSVTAEGLVGRCHSILDPKFIPIDDAVKDIDSYENWSKLCLQNIGALLARQGSMLGL